MTYTTAIRATDDAVTRNTHSWIWSGLRWQQHLVDLSFVRRPKIEAAASARQAACRAFEDASRASLARGGRGLLDC